MIASRSKLHFALISILPPPQGYFNIKTIIKKKIIIPAVILTIIPTIINNKKLYEFLKNYVMRMRVWHCGNIMLTGNPI